MTLIRLRKHLSSFEFAVTVRVFPQYGRAALCVDPKFSGPALIDGLLHPRRI